MHVMFSLCLVFGVYPHAIGSKIQSDAIRAKRMIDPMISRMVSFMVTCI